MRCYLLNCGEIFVLDTSLPLLDFSQPIKTNPQTCFIHCENANTQLIFYFCLLLTRVVFLRFFQKPNGLVLLYYIIWYLTDCTLFDIQMCVMLFYFKTIFQSKRDHFTTLMFYDKKFLSCLPSIKVFTLRTI